MLTAYFAPSPFAGLKELPSRLLVAAWGLNKSTRGEDFTVNEQTTKFLPAVQKAMGFDTCCLDFNHNTVSRDGKRVVEPQPVAAHGVPTVVPGEGVYLDQLQWTPEGKTAALGGHYPDLSPAIKTNDKGELMFLHSAGMCRQGDVATLKLFAALDATQLKLFSAATGAVPLNETTENMDYKTLLLTLLGLGQNASDEQITNGAQEYAVKLEKACGTAEGLKTMSADFAKLLARIDTNERDSAIADAIRAGKLVPHSVKELPLAQALKIIGELPAGVVPLDRRTPEGVKTHSSDAITGEAQTADEQVRKAMGISAETWKKHQAA